MKICIGQTKSEKGNVQRNIENHLEFIGRAIKLNADLIIFPELSITNYEPELATELATDIESSIFSPFQEISNINGISIGIGMPTKTTDGINIATSFLGSYNTKVDIAQNSDGSYTLTFIVDNPSTWDSATRLRIDNDGDGNHDGIFPNTSRNDPNTINIGGTINQTWTWTEIVN